MCVGAAYLVTMTSMYFCAWPLQCGATILQWCYHCNVHMHDPFLVVMRAPPPPNRACSQNQSLYIATGLDRILLSFGIDLNGLFNNATEVGVHVSSLCLCSIAPYLVALHNGLNDSCMAKSLVIVM